MAFFWFLLFVLAGVWGVRATKRANEAARRASQLTTERDALQGNNAALYQYSLAVQQQLQQVVAENQDLAKYRPIVDVDREIQQRRAGIAAAEAAAQHQAATIVGAANQQAAAVVADAYTKARAIAGEALDAKENVEVYRAEARALKNVIEGYGDRYLVATESVLDGLAAGLAHTDAGAKLKEARQRTRAMVKNGRAAQCDYVEAERRAAAIAFVVDAFNGKAESILASAKADNFGTLCQKLEDSFALVNKNGRAFRNARVLRPYLEARSEELRWAVIAHELREREREEQRRLKEQIREEEKARREYERARKEAAKEEEVIRRAMAKAEQEIARATDEQRAKYEAQLQELAARLQAAEEKNQRALSMAQQTKRGHVYIISNIGSFGENVFKIGLTRRLDPLDRIRELGDASVPFDFDVHALIWSEDAPALERALHRHFLKAQMNKVNPRKEFFRAPLTTIREEVERLGIQATWTMTAAAQYRESLAIEQAIQADPAAYEAWLNRQLVLDPVVMDDADDEDESISVAAQHRRWPEPRSRAGRVTGNAVSSPSRTSSLARGRSTAPRSWASGLRAAPSGLAD